MDYKTLRPSQTLLDPQNPRLSDGTANDREAINRLLVEGYNQMLALARDLVERGEGNPTELPIVVKDSSKYVVLEGNRRFAVLKLLADPKLADDELHQAAFERIKRKSGAHPPQSLYCAVAKDRDEADPWLTLRHTGANDGVGVRVWSAEQNARHRRRMKAPIDGGTVRSIAIADELTEAYQADQELVDLIKKVRGSKLTNIGRLFSGVTLTRMQFAMKQVSETGSQTLWAKHTADQLHPYFIWAFKYLVDNSVDAFKNDELRGNLINDNADILPAPSDSMADHKRLADHPYAPGGSGGNGASDQSDQTGDDPSVTSSEDGSTSSSSANGSGSTGDTNDSGDQKGGDSGGKRDAKPERFLYSIVKLPNLSPNTQRLLREAKQLVIDDNYAVACVLSRVILELAVSDPKVLAWSGKAENDTLNKKIRACILKLDPLIDNPTKRTRQELEQAFLEVETIGIRYLHQFMHNSETKADPHLARRFSAAFTPLLNSINEAVA